MKISVIAPRHELSRRKLIALAGSGSFAALFLAACGGNQPPRDILADKFARIRIGSDGEWAVPSNLLVQNPPSVACVPYSPQVPVLFKMLSPLITSGSYSINAQVAVTWVGPDRGSLGMTGVEPLFQYAANAVLNNKQLGLTPQEKERALEAVVPAEISMTFFNVQTASGRYGPIPPTFVTAPDQIAADRIARNAIETGDYNGVFQLAGQFYPPASNVFDTSTRQTGTTQFLKDQLNGLPRAFWGVMALCDELILTKQIFENFIPEERLAGGLMVNEFATLPAVGIELIAPQKLENYRATNRLQDTRAAREALTTQAHLNYLQGK